MLKRVLVFLCLFGFVETVKAKPLFTYETFTLKNGLQFILLENKRAPIVCYTTWYRVGSADEVPGKTGLAHYLEHLRDDGSPEVQMGEFLEEIKATGRHSNAYTWQDSTYYFTMVTSDRLELLMRLEGGRVRGIAFNKDMFEKEKNVILEERLMSTENEPTSLFSEKFNSQFFSAHPYKNPIIGWEKDIKALTYEDMISFYKKWYHPNNAFIIISGNFNPKEVRAWAEKYYGDIPAGPKAERNRAEESYKKAKVDPIIVEHPRTAVPSLSMIYQLPALKKGHYKDLLALLVLTEYLNGDFEGSLYESLVHKSKLATGFSASCFSYEFLDPWSFSLVAWTPSPEKSKEIEKLVYDRLDQLGREGIKPEELGRTKKYFVNSLLTTMDDIYLKAKFLGTVLSGGLTLEQISSLPQDMDQVTSSDIQHVIQTYLQKDRAVIGILKKSSGLKGS